MKKIVLLVMLIAVLSMSAQIEISNYHMSFFGNEKTNFKIKITRPDRKNRFNFYIEVFSMDKISNGCYLIVNSKKLEKFKSNLLKAKQKFIEWDSVAKKNKVTDFVKKIKVEKDWYEASFSYGGWHKDNDVKLLFAFSVDKKGIPSLIITNKYKLIASNNEFIKSKGFFMYFQSVDEIDELLERLDSKIVFDYFNKNDNNSKLFKD